MDARLNQLRKEEEEEEQFITQRRGIHTYVSAHFIRTLIT